MGSVSRRTAGPIKGIWFGLYTRVISVSIVYRIISLNRFTGSLVCLR